ncbi:SAM-dependent methyltransferase [Rhodococcus sp. WMMA185]|uniref:class I SAM-dependent methyltransferase n=1 Tax=Rhodococcus sp. WMMA185 TaxID=679318 RepID=UPI00087D98F4|nr:SAM-dependent methyltransferase [Rhodococcus sp. WMMA185]
MLDRDALFSRLRRSPDIEAPNLVAVDATDRLILDESARELSQARPGTIVVIGDRYGALTIGAAATHGSTGIRVHQDPLTGELALAGNAQTVGLADRYRSCTLGEELLTGATVVLMQLPRSLSELTEIAEAIARYADPSVVVYAGGRDKHISRTMNDALGRSFAEVRATLGRQKSRVLIATGPLEVTAPTYPVTEHIAEIGLDVISYGAAFAGSKLDIGTRYLLEFLPRVNPRARTAVDLGCGTGILAVTLARCLPEISVIATDQSAAAVASADATARANGFGDRVSTLRDDAMSSLETDSQDLILCNPPFHVGAAVHTGAASKMFAEAGRVLRPGGEMWTVYNSHLGYRGMLRRLVGPTDVVGRIPKFTVTKSVV